MLLKIADNYDEEVDNAVAAMTSLLEPIMIVFLAIVVGSIVIAMFLPLIAPMNGIDSPLEASNVFPPMVISMVDVGEQTGALPEMLLKIADNYDEEVDNAVSAMTSAKLEPIMIVFLGHRGRQHRHRHVPAADCVLMNGIDLDRWRQKG